MMHLGSIPSGAGIAHALQQMYSVIRLVEKHRDSSKTGRLHALYHVLQFMSCCWSSMQCFEWQQVRPLEAVHAIQAAFTCCTS